MKKLTTILFAALFLLSCGRKQPIVILFENDVHCAIDGYAQLAGQRDVERATTPYVTLITCGDYAQGNSAGSLTKGEAIVRIMNAVGYDYGTIGNHEFDYTVPQMLNMANELQPMKTLCCNFSYAENGEQLFPAYDIKNYGGTKVGFVGVATPTTFRTSTPTYFIDENGNLLYDFHLSDTYQLVQQAVDEVRAKGADYVVVISHLGDDDTDANSRNLIAATHGIDIVMDGHSHHLLCERLANANGDSTILTSTSTKFNYIGRLTIPQQGEMQVELLPIAECTTINQQVADTILAIKQELEAITSRVVGYAPFELTDRDENGVRIIRGQESGIGNFIADIARFTTGAQIGVVNGGGIRNGIKEGDITYGDVVAIWPFNNKMRVTLATGQQLLDAFEVAVAGLPNESGDFILVSGLRYTVDTSIPGSVIWDENHMFSGVGSTRRIVSMEVETPNGFMPIDPNQTYSVGGQSYIIASGGASGMFMKMNLQPISQPELGDVDAFINYLHQLGDTIPDTYKQLQGRITIK